MLLLQLALKTKAHQKQGFESPTGYPRPLTFVEWFFAFMLLLQLALKTKAHQKQGFESPTGYQKPLIFVGWFFAFMLLLQLALKTKAHQKKGFESPTGYQKPLTLAGWFFAFVCSCREPKSPVKIPNILSKTNQNVRIVIGNLATKCSSRRIYIFMNSNNLRQSY